MKTTNFKYVIGAAIVMLLLAGSAWAGGKGTGGTPYFAYEDGSPYSLKPGRTWIELVPTYFAIGLNSADEAGSRP